MSSSEKDSDNYQCLSDALNELDLGYQTRETARDIYFFLSECLLQKPVTSDFFSVKTTVILYALLRQSNPQSCSPQSVSADITPNNLMGFLDQNKAVFDLPVWMAASLVGAYLHRHD